MEKKFRVDMDFDNDNLSNKDIFDQTRAWVFQEIKDRSNTIKSSDVYYIEGLQIYPYAVVFVLFFNGFHKIALEYLEQKRHCSPEFISMYHDFVNKYDSHCFPKHELLHY